MKKPNDKAITAAKIVAGVAAALTLAANVTGCVYGPPTRVESESSTTEKTKAETTAPETTPDLKNNQNEDVYGPPEVFDTSENEVPAVYGPPEDFDTSANELPDVYGPPGDNG